MNVEVEWDGIDRPRRYEAVRRIEALLCDDAPELAANNETLYLNMEQVRSIRVLSDERIGLEAEHAQLVELLRQHAGAYGSAGDPVTLLERLIDRASGR